MAELSPFVFRHLGPSENDISQMLATLQLKSVDELIKKSAPDSIISKKSLDLGAGYDEAELIDKATQLAKQNKVFKSYIGQGYYPCHTPAVIQRNILESPAWYTAYTPYQAEISQGRMEALLNFQTMLIDLTGLEVANASLLDEGTAAAEAISMAYATQRRNPRNTVYVSDKVFTQTRAVIETRCQSLGFDVQFTNESEFDYSKAFAVCLQYPDSRGEVSDYSEISKKAADNNCLTIAIADILSLCLLKPPGEWGADIVVGSTQRFGVPMGFGGPHAAYLVTKEKYKRLIPGRIIGVSKDQNGQTALRLALQTREQHIRREKATSNICTAQVLLAVMASMYAVYHGPMGLKKIATRIHLLTNVLRKALSSAGIKILNQSQFDTLCLDIGDKKLVNQFVDRAKQKKLNLGVVNDTQILLSLDETKSPADIIELLDVFQCKFDVDSELKKAKLELPPSLVRKSEFLTHPVFNSYHSETEMLRYIYKLQNKDLTLANAMIPLGSCTMKLNATTEMQPITWPEFANIHPFAPSDQTQGYRQLIFQLENWLCALTGFAGVSLQPNAGSQGEYAGLLIIRKYLESKGQEHRKICLIPSSAHGTNPASTVIAGMKVVVVNCDSQGNIELEDLKEKIAQHKDELAALMVTYPSTHGVFEESIVDICDLIHQAGGQVYMDGANLNALVGFSYPGEFGPDVCHLNLHKTFCIPHGGGGPGVGPVAVASHLTEFLPTHPLEKDCGGKKGISPVSAAPWGSAAILPISWAYIAMMGSKGMELATQVAILNANYMAKKLEPHYPILYRGKNNFVAHECIIDVRPFKQTAGVSVDDFAKRLMDYGFHAPTMSWPVAGTLMIEPTESESKAEIDRFIEAMIQIREEIREIEEGKADPKDNVLVNAPHSVSHLTENTWTHPYSREQAAFPLPWVKEHKFWVPVGRVDNAYGDKNLVCSCPSLDSYT